MEFLKDEFIAKDGSSIIITFYAHASIGLLWKGIQIYIDPAGDYNQIDFSREPKADIILITHHHRDHLDCKSINQLNNGHSFIVSSKECKVGIETKPGDIFNIHDLTIEVVPAYNITLENLNYHPKSRYDCGYILNIGGSRIYFAGDTEDNDDVLSLRNIEIAFLPINQPYTMNATQFVNVIRAITPKIVYPYHYFQEKIEEDLKLIMSSLTNKFWYK